MPYENAKVGALIVAAGSGSRMNSRLNKQYLKLDGTPVILHTLLPFAESELFDEVVVILPKEDVDTWGKVLEEHLTFKCNMLKVTAGGDTRQQSVTNGLLTLAEDIDIVAIHDGVRPFVKACEIKAVLESAFLHGAATLGTKVNETIKRVDWDAHEVWESIDRNSLCATKTPQAFKFELIKTAHESAQQDGFIGNDDCELVERLGHRVVIVEGSSDNIKITTKEDMSVAESILNRKNQEVGMVLQKNYRSGIGYDAHKLVEGRPLILGGVEVPFHKGLLGHSDADVLLHSISDALLGASALGDIGVHFPDSLEEFSGISSMILLSKVVEILKQHNFKIVNIDATIVAQKPKLAPFFGEMAQNIAKAALIEVNQVNIKGTTTEGMGFTGTGEGISAYAIATIVPFRSEF